MSLRWTAVLPLLLAGASAPAQPPSAAAGPITHTLTGYKVVREIPASWTIARFKRIAKPEPAPEGHAWYVLTGKASDGAADARSVNLTTYRVRDAQGKEYRPDVKKVLYRGGAAHAEADGRLAPRVAGRSRRQLRQPGVQGQGGRRGGERHQERSDT